MFEDLLKGNPLTVVAVGLGAVLLAPMAGQVLRPMVKEVIKGGMLAYRGLAELGQTMGDIMAEAQHELGASHVTEADTAGTPALGGAGENRSREAKR